jgi:hypothetical protein
MRTISRLLALGVLGLAAPATPQTPAQDVTAAMQGQLGAQVQQGCSNELTRYCAEVTPGEGPDAAASTGTPEAADPRSAAGPARRAGHRAAGFCRL